MKIVICTHKSWNIENAHEFLEKNRQLHQVKIVEEKEDFTADSMEAFQPDFIFFPHWSYLIPKEIFDSYPCIVFHMTDLPFGRGGSPLQNLIARGIEKTKISAIRVEEGLDTGAVYWKEELDLSGNADDIFRRASDIIFANMIPQILTGTLVPCRQEGEVVAFKRRKPEQSRLEADMDLRQLYNHIRMLDGEGYPKAYLELGKYRLEFTEAYFIEGRLTAKVAFQEESR